MLKSKAIVKSTAAFNPTFGITAKSSDFEPIEKPREKISIINDSKRTFSALKFSFPLKNSQPSFP